MRTNEQSTAMNIASVVERVYTNSAIQGKTVSDIGAELGRNMKKLREHAHSASLHEKQTVVEEWLCDNYYLLERETKEIQKQFRYFQKKAPKSGLYTLYALCNELFGIHMCEISADTLLLLCREANKRKPLCFYQLEYLPGAIKASLLNMAYTAICADHSQELARSMIAFAVQGISTLYGIDFEAVIEASSVVEGILLCDPAGVYPRMSAKSKRHYRYCIAKIAAAGKITEDEAARHAISLADKAAAEEQAHVGFYILRHESLTRSPKRRGKWMIGVNIGASVILALLLAIWAKNALVLVLTLLPLFEMVRPVTERLALAGLDSDHLPRMELRDSELALSVVVVSTLLPKAGDCGKLREHLVRLYHSNRSEQLCFCVLADFKEHDSPQHAQDNAQIGAAVRMIESLNEEFSDSFLLFLRKRSYSKTQNRFCGWERKRGAITELIRFIRGEETSVQVFCGNREKLCQSQYMIALDADTQLLFDSAKTMISAAMHPLNQPQIGEKGIVERGYGILTPRIGFDLQGPDSTAFSRVMAGCGGVTAYDTSSKDVYQDLFFEAIFAGKGLIVIDAFHTLLSEHLPENRILSHDIIESAYLRTGYLSDVEMTDASPTNALSWLSRLHRWIRGDWQNILFLRKSFTAEQVQYENPISALSKYKLADNLRRSLTPVLTVLCFFAAIAAPPRARLVLCAVAFLSLLFGPLLSAVSAVASGGSFSLSQKYFSRAMPGAFQSMGQALFSLILLPQTAFVAADAIVRALWRSFVSHKKLMEWTTAAQAEISSRGIWKAALLRCWASTAIGLAMLLFCTHPLLRLAGLAFAGILIMVVFTARVRKKEGQTLTGEQREQLLSYCAAMWRYYEDFVTPRHHYLPPDNIQLSPVYALAARTSPTNIGIMLLSTLAARDFDFIDTKTLCRRVSNTLCTIERMEKWKGNLYNWYETETLHVMQPAFVSAVDSGNFLCCLIALREGLCEYAPGHPGIIPLIGRINAIIEQTELTAMYSPKRRLFSIGYDAQSGQLSGSHYDFLMSEARMTSYYAVAARLVDRKHWGALNRSMSKSGSYAGAVSWTGTMFEYFMPHLVLPEYEGSLLHEALRYCLYCQRRRTKKAGAPWGISESSYYSFDNNLNYQYKAHGVQKLGVKRGLDKELVVSPYSTFLVVNFSPAAAMKNLARLREMGMLGRYGFFEAADFTKERVGSADFSIIRSYMAHHIGMSMVAACNAVLGNKMQKRFMSDVQMGSAREFLMEKIGRDTLVHEDFGLKSLEEKKKQPSGVEEIYTDISPVTPRTVLLSNGSLTDVLTDTGAGYLASAGAMITPHTGDLLRRAQGVFAFVKADGISIPVTMAPLYDTHVSYSAQFEGRSVTYYARRSQIEAGMRCMMHPTLSGEQRHLVIKNESGKKICADVLFYLEPVLSRHADHAAHPGFSKLFVGVRYDKDSRTLSFTRRSRHKSGEGALWLTVGLLEDIQFEYETKRENLMSAPNGMHDLTEFDKKSFGKELGVPDPACALRLKLNLSPGAQAGVTLLLSVAGSRQDGIADIIAMRRQSTLESRQAALSPVIGDSLSGRLAMRLLSRLVYPFPFSEQKRSRLAVNRLGQSGLWQMSISGDLPMILIEQHSAFDERHAEAYMKLQQTLRICGIEFDLVFLYDSMKMPDVRELVYTCAQQADSALLMDQRGGIFVVDSARFDTGTINLLKACACHISDGNSLPEQPYSSFIPIRMSRTVPAAMPAVMQHKVYGGGFLDNRFYVERLSPLPYCHVLANPEFGTLLSDKALGFTWAINARENKLTPWYNDITADNTGEMLLLLMEGEYFNLLSEARASFSQSDAMYECAFKGVCCTVRVTVPQKGHAKHCEILLENHTKKELELMCAYYIEPVLGVDRSGAGYITGHVSERGFVMTNRYQTAVKSSLALSCEDGDFRCAFDRPAFLSGRWMESGSLPYHDPCGALIVPKRLPPGRSERIRFILSFGADETSAELAADFAPADAALAPKGNTYSIQTPDAALDSFINGFAAHQIVAGRIYGRCGFYQCGGAYGFRDQLQDVCAYLLIDPDLAKRHIYRCCAVQFPEGDVLHWWHDLPADGAGLRGVRTRYSDDLLWLPYTVSEYIERTGEISILDTPIPYLAGEPLREEEHERYFAPTAGEILGSVYEHCMRAIRKADTTGELGLPLIGCGDWNDGFNRVGIGGRGQSVWLAMFLAHVMERFAHVSERRGSGEDKHWLLERARSLKEAVDTHCWDGQWYLRAFFDDGAKMGSHENAECRIDSLPQSFASIAGLPDQQRVQAALDNAIKYLVDEDLQIVRLFTPPFSGEQQDPGYVAAYPQGIRENGGQYTHAAVWLALGLLRQGRANDGARILKMLNPAQRCTDKRLAALYKIEPYYMAADICANPQAAGRGGWSLYTGAASWYYRTVLEDLLGLQMRGDRLLMAPCLPDEWQEAAISAEISGTRLEIAIRRTGEYSFSCDGKACAHIPLDGGSHRISVTI